MADVSVTASSVQAANSNTVTARGIAADTIAAGQSVWADPANNNQIKRAQATYQTQATNVVGIALDGAYPGQPVTYAVSGDVTFNSAFTTSTVYVLSGTNPGGIAPSADLDSSSGTWYGTVLGISTSATNLRLGITSSGALNP